jgi:hypothetical protein
MFEQQEDENLAAGFELDSVKQIGEVIPQFLIHETLLFNRQRFQIESSSDLRRKIIVDKVRRHRQISEEALEEAIVVSVFGHGGDFKPA